MATYDYLKKETGSVPKDADLMEYENMSLMQVGNPIDLWSPIAEKWLYGSVIKAGETWVECMFGSLAVTISLDDKAQWAGADFDIRSAA
mgnify:FL=1|jgi:hypothetical protein|tara:strand:- start:75 stop:341 length:267 start_codon:yes stop_codon:yes gene_type:complete